MAEPKMRPSPPSRYPTPVRGREAIEEATRLLGQIRFSAQRGAYAKGHHVAVSVDPQWNEDQETIRVLITCRACGHRHVDWAGMPLFSAPEGKGQVASVARLDARGQCLFPSLLPGEYAVIVSPRWGHGVLPRVEERDWTRVYASADGAVLTTVSSPAPGRLRLAAQSREAALAGASVRFSLRYPGAPGGQVSSAVTLEPSPEQSGLWEGRWESGESLGLAAAGAEEAEVVFCVLPPSLRTEPHP